MCSSCCVSTWDNYCTALIIATVACSVRAVTFACVTKVSFTSNHMIGPHIILLVLIIRPRWTNNTSFLNFATSAVQSDFLEKRNKVSLESLLKKMHCSTSIFLQSSGETVLVSGCFASDKAIGNRPRIVDALVPPCTIVTSVTFERCSCFNGQTEDH